MYAAFQSRESLYLVLEYKERGNLRTFIRERNGATEEQTSNPQLTVEFIIACILCGLSHLHRKGIIHRDIKPSNLVIDSEGYVALTDFGISQFISKEEVGASGTPGYMGIACH